MQSVLANDGTRACRRVTIIALNDTKRRGEGQSTRCNAYFDSILLVCCFHSSFHFAEGVMTGWEGAKRHGPEGGSKAVNIFCTCVRLVKGCAYSVAAKLTIDCHCPLCPAQPYAH